MKEKRIPRYFAGLTFPLLLFMSNACSNVGSELRRLINDPSTVLVIKDVNNAYWALSVSRIKQIDGDKIVIQGGTIVAKGSGTVSPDEMAKKLIDLRSKANPGGFGATEFKESGTSGEASGKIELIEKDLEVKVEEIVYPTKKP